jgi:hypothetical protein
VLHALPELAAEVDVAAGYNVEGNEFDRCPEIAWPSGALLVGWNILIPQKMIGGLRFAQQLTEDLRGKQKNQ